MKNYRVTITFTVTAEYHVSAQSEHDAHRKAQTEWNQDTLEDMDTEIQGVTHVETQEVAQ